MIPLRAADFLPRTRRAPAIASALALLLAGCATAASTRHQLEAQTQQNRDLLRIEQQKMRSLTDERAALQRQLEEKQSQREELEIQPPTPQRQEEIAEVQAEIARLKKALLQVSE